MNAFKGKYGPLLIAEIGSNHEGNFDYAKKLIELAISTNVDCIKLQLYKADTIVSPVESLERNLHFKKFELKKDQYLKLANIVKDSGLKFIASVWDNEMIEWIDDFISIYKIGSGDLTAYPIIKIIAETGKPIILSTGLSTMDEILDAISYIQKENNLYYDSNYLALLQCTSMYPIDNTDANLNVILELVKKTNLTIGYSDHTIGIDALKYAYAMGAKILEFHFTDIREEKEFRDHKVSLIPDEVAELINQIKLINELKGSPIKKPTKIEIDNMHHISFRRAVYLRESKPKGYKVQEKDLILLRPNVGIDARDWKKVIGKCLRKDFKAFERINWDDLENDLIK